MAQKIALVILLLATAAAAAARSTTGDPISICDGLKSEIMQAVRDELSHSREEVNSTLERAVDKVTSALDHASDRISDALSQLEKVNSTLTDYSRLREIHEEELIRRENIGESWRFPAYSCREIAERNPLASSGLYWVQTCQFSTPVRVHCDLDKLLDSSKGWMRVALLDMTNPQQQCPPGFNFIPSPRRVCGRTTNGPGCNSVTFKTLGVQYQKVCGRVVGYQYNTPDAFKRLACPSPCTIDKHYVDGISITHGSQPRKHVWTYAAAYVETSYSQYQCPCNSVPGIQPPSFVGNDYYCESALYARPPTTTLLVDDVLWDGERCDGYEGGCCLRPNLPWFCKDLPEPTVDDLEVRLCFDENKGNEDAPIELVELYVQ